MLKRSWILKILVPTPHNTVIHFTQLSDHRLVTLVVSAKNSLWRSWFLPTTLFHFDDTIIVFSLWFQCLVLYFIFIGWVPPLYLCIQVCSSVCVLYISHILSSIMHCNLFEIYIGTWYQLLVEFDYWFDIVLRGGWWTTINKKEKTPPMPIGGLGGWFWFWQLKIRVVIGRSGSVWLYLLCCGQNLLRPG